MSIIGGYRYSGATLNSATKMQGDMGALVNVGTMKISGLSDTAGLICCHYIWNSANSQWEPMLQPATT